jgi:hypothetical protein
MLLRSVLEADPFERIGIGLITQVI